MFKVTNKDARETQEIISQESSLINLNKPSSSVKEPNVEVIHYVHKDWQPKKHGNPIPAYKLG